MMTEDEAERRFNQWTNNMARLEWIVKIQIEQRFRDGKMRGVSSQRETDATSPFIRIRYQPSPRRLLPPPVIVPRRRTVPRPNEAPPQSPPQSPGNDVPEDRVFDDLQEFPEIMDCFSSEGFDSRRFGQFAQHFLRQKEEMGEGQDQIAREKAKRIGQKALGKA